MSRFEFESILMLREGMKVRKRATELFRSHVVTGQNALVARRVTSHSEMGKRISVHMQVDLRSAPSPN